MPTCYGCVSLPFLDGRMGLGVAGETKQAILRGEPTWYVAPTKKDATQEDLDEFVKNPHSSLFMVRQFTGEEKELIVRGDPTFVVPHQETRLRTFYVYNKVMRPYAEAHLVSMPIPEGFYPNE